MTGTLTYLPLHVQGVLRMSPSARRAFPLGEETRRVGVTCSFVKSKAAGLAEVLANASATRYRWYEVWYRVPDSFYHRKSFEVQIGLETIARAVTTFHVHPTPGGTVAPTAAGRRPPAVRRGRRSRPGHRCTGPR